MGDSAWAQNATPQSVTPVSTALVPESALASLIVGLNQVKAIYSGSNLTISSGPSSLTADGTSISSGDTFWANSQTNPAQDGPWIYHGFHNAFTRPAWFATGTTFPPNMLFYSGAGTVFGGRIMRVVRSTSGVVDTDATFPVAPFPYYASDVTNLFSMTMPAVQARIWMG